jgi:hypothetical protein
VRVKVVSPAETEVITGAPGATATTEIDRSGEEAEAYRVVVVVVAVTLQVPTSSGVSTPVEVTEQMVGVLVV